jgi:hypothetical protein
MGNLEKLFNLFFMVFLVFIIFLPLFVYSSSVEMIPQGVHTDVEGGIVSSVIISTQALAGDFYIGGRPAEEQLLGYRARSILGQRFIGVGFDNATNLRVELGMEKLLNYNPVINATAINAYKIMSKHPHTNDTLICTVNLTDKDIGDRLTIHIEWYRNSTNWYNNDDEINYNNLSNLVDIYNIEFEKWPHNNETWRHTMLAQSYYETRTAPFRMFEPYDTRVLIGSISPEDTKHYDLWVCSVQVFDGTFRTEWAFSNPIFIYNHRPDYDDTMRTYYSWKEDDSKEIDIGSYFSDIDDDFIEYYINYTSNLNPGRFSVGDFSYSINNVSGLINFFPNSNQVGFMDLILTGIDQNESYTSDLFLENDYGQTSTDVITLNILQENDAPWVTDIFITPALPTYEDTLYCQYTYNDLEFHPENTNEVSFQWWIQKEGIGDWDLIEGVNSSSLTSTQGNFGLNDRVICSVRVKDTYFDWPGYSWLRTSYFGKLIGSTYDNKENPYETQKEVIKTDELDKWYHIVNSVNISNNERKIYVDGLLVKESNDVIENLSEYINWRLGQREGSFEGLMDEVAIWNRILNSNEILELYTGNEFGYKFYGNEFTGNETIIIDLDRDNKYTPEADFVFVNNGGLNAGDVLYKVTKDHRIFADSINPNDVTCIYYATYEQMNDGTIPLENYYLGSNCAAYGGTFLNPSDIQILEEHDWVVNKNEIDSSTSFIYESNYALTYSNSADTIVSNAINPASNPNSGDILSLIEPHFVFHDANNNGVYDHGEPIIHDVNCNLIFNSGTDIVLRGSDPANDVLLTRFNSGPRAYPLIGLDTNLQAYYDFNNNYNSLTGNNHGSNQGTIFNDGLSCQAAQFSKNSYIDLDLIKNDVYTISMWVKFNTMPIFPWQYTPDFLPQMPWLYSGDDVDQSLFSEFTNSSAITIVLSSEAPTDEGQIVIGVG